MTHLRYCIAQTFFSDKKREIKRFQRRSTQIKLSIKTRVCMCGSACTRVYIRARIPTAFARLSWSRLTSLDSLTEWSCGSTKPTHSASSQLLALLTLHPGMLGMSSLPCPAPQAIPPTQITVSHLGSDRSAWRILPYRFHGEPHSAFPKHLWHVVLSHFYNRKFVLVAARVE